MQPHGVLVGMMPERTRKMVLLNVVCFGTWHDLLHGHVISALNSSTGPGFCLDWRPAGPEPGMLELEALVTYVPATEAGWRATRRTTGRAPSGARIRKPGTRSASSVLSGDALSCSTHAIRHPTTGFTTMTDSGPSATPCLAGRFWAGQGISPRHRSLTGDGSWENS